MPDVEILERVKSAQARVQEREAELNRQEARELQLRESLEEFKERCRAEGVDPSKLDELIADTTKTLETKLQELEANLNGTQTETTQADPTAEAG